MVIGVTAKLNVFFTMGLLWPNGLLIMMIMGLLINNNNITHIILTSATA
jgi:hypothetical protein